MTIKINGSAPKEINPRQPAGLIHIILPINTEKTTREIYGKKITPRKNHER